MQEIKTRELTVWTIIGGSFRVFAAQFRYVLPVCIAFFLPVRILDLFVPGDLIVNLMNSDFILYDPIAPAYMRYLLIFMGIQLLFTPLAAGGLSYITIQHVEKRPVAFAGIMEASLIKWPKLVYTAFIYYLLIMLTAFLVLPAIYGAVAFMLYACIAAISNKYGFSALLISRVLMRGRWLKGFLLLIGTYMVNFLLQNFVVTILGNMGFLTSAAATVIVGVLLDILGSFSYIAVCLFYINIHYHLKSEERPLT